MPLMSTCVARLGSRYSIILDPVRRQIHYGALGLMRQCVGELVAGIDDQAGTFTVLPLSKAGGDFHNCDQQQTMTSVVYEANCLKIGVRMRMTITAPFWPRDERTSLVPAYIVRIKVSRPGRVRWEKIASDARRKGVVRLGIKLPGVEAKQASGRVRMDYPVSVGGRMSTGEGAGQQEYGGGRHVPTDGASTDRIVPLDSGWSVVDGMLEVPFDLSGEVPEQEFAAAMLCWCGDGLFERFGKPMRLKYTSMWKGPEEVAEFVRGNWRQLVAKSERFDRLISGSSLPAAAADLTAQSFQSYLMCTLWCVGEQPREWFSVWEGSCWFNSTVDVTYNEAMFYFSCWPELLEMLFEEWAQHANDYAEERRRRAIKSDDHEPLTEFPGAIMQHDMGAGWTANGQSYHHMMPVEENSNFLLMLYAHGVWWGKQELFRKYARLSRSLAEYLFWTDSTGNGFPDRGTANTIDDATPAVQYGRDNVYLGIKRLAALHAAGRMAEQTGDADLAARCAKEVRRAVKTLNAGWLGDHWGVCLDKSAVGLIDCWTKKPLDYKVLPGWDAYSLYTTNGLLMLMMIDDLPPGLDRRKLRSDVVNAAAASMTTYGCGHSSMDKENMWVSMNVWRDCAAGYLGIDMLVNCERYWNQQVYGNGIGSEKPNCFTETSLTNNLVWYPRGAATFGLLLSTSGLAKKGESAAVSPIATGTWPLLPLADWKRGKVPTVEIDAAQETGEVRVPGAQEQGRKRPAAGPRQAQRGTKSRKGRK